MLRENETSRVGAVLEHARAGDRDAMVRSAIELWVTPAESDGEGDAAHADVWRAIVEVGAVDAAVAAALAVIRDGQRIRPHAFIDVGEATSDFAVLCDIAQRTIK